MDNFIVSARKYRPATFATVVGQAHITSTLKNAISRGQLAHAYLFCGPRGVGKTTCARIFAKAINCTSPIDNEACGQCESCRSFNEGRSFNIHELDAASNNSVDDIRSLTDQVRIPPQVGRYSVYIIDEVHMLSQQAFNAFLKTLEEPPAHAVFVLATTEKHKILPTILSRCQIYDFNRIRVEDGVEYLKYIASQEGVAYDDESLHLIARKADGAMRDALSMFDKAVSFCGSGLDFKEVARTLNVLDYDTYFKVTELILAGDYPSTLTLFDEVLRKGFSGQSFITGLNGHFRDLLMCKAPQTLGLLEVTGTLLERYRQQAAGCDAGFLFDSIAVMTALDGTLRTASNQRLNIELGLMKLCGLGQKKNSEVGEKAPLPPLARSSSAVASAATPSSTGVSAENPSSASAHVEDLSSAGVVAPLKSPAVAANLPKSSEAAATTSPKSEETPPAATVAAMPESEVEPAASSIPAAAPESESEQQTPTPAHAKPVPDPVTPPVRKNGNGGPTISGAPISSLLNAPKNRYAETEATDSSPADSDLDPESEQKLEKHRETIIRALKTDRPRISVVFEGMKLSGHTVSVAVPTEALREEILRNRTEILTLMSEVASVDGILELEVIVREDKGGLRPVKPEDKLRFLTEKNPALTDLRRKLEMEIE